MSDYILIRKSTLTNIGNAIRTKKGTSALIDVPDIPSEISSISGGSSETDVAEILDGSVTSMSNSEATRIVTSGLANRNSLVSVDFPNVTSIGNTAFDYDSALKNVNMPKLANGSGYGFRSCAIEHIQFAGFTDASNTGGYLFLNNYPLKIVDFNSLSRIEAGAFQGCADIRAIIIRRTTGIVNLLSTNAFASGGVLKTDFTVYVSQSLVSSYQQGTNWSVMYAENNDLFQPLEGSIFENPNYDADAIIAEWEEEEE